MMMGSNVVQLGGIRKRYTDMVTTFGNDTMQHFFAAILIYTYGSEYDM